jgi:GAF domain-containing protein
MSERYSRLPADFLDRLRDLLGTVQSAQVMMRPEADDDRLARIVRLAVAQSGAELGLLLLVDEDRGDLHVAAAVGEPVAALVGSHVARTGLAGFAIDDGNPVAVADLAGAGHGARDEIEERAGLSTRSLLAVPLVVHGRSSGALELRNAPDPRGFTPADIELVTELAYLAAAAVEEFRGDRFLLSLFAAALPRALDPADADPESTLQAELERWLAELRQTPAWRRQLDLIARAHEVCAAGDHAVELARTILEAVAARERREPGP